MRYCVWFLACFEIITIVLCVQFEETLRNTFCVTDDFQESSSDCQEYSNEVTTNCSSFELPEFQHISTDLKAPQLICKNANEMRLSWKDTEPSSNFLEYYSEISTDDHTYSEPTTCNQLILQNLSANSTYYIRRWKVWSETNTYFMKSSHQLVAKTMSADILLPIPSFKVKNLTLNEYSYDVIVEWMPANDTPCIYRLDAFGVTIGELFTTESNIFTLPPYEEKIPGLKFSNQYNLTIRSISRGISSSFIESPPSYITVDIPSCLDSYANLSICAPPPPENVTTSANCNTESCNVLISWSIPELIPDEYVIYVHNLSVDTNYIINVTVSGTNNSIIVEDLSTGIYEIIVRAVSKGGNSRSAVITESFTAENINPDSGLTTKIITILTAFTIGIVIVIFIFLKRRNSRKFKSQINNLYSKELFKIDVLKKSSGDAGNKHIDEWELPAESITIEGVLGEGAFGLVKKGILKKTDGQSLEVGIKMLKSLASYEEARQLYQEIAIMKSVGTHPNLVSMIGCVTEAVDGPLLIVEYCPHGDLQSFLRKEWERLNNFYRDTNQPIFGENDYNVFNKTYAANVTDDFLTPNDLLSFARQITLGMEHLSKLRVLHRDLAARNVLVCDNKLVKVSDFGLSRDVYQNNVYWKQGGGKLPIRWMALESITHQKYTTQSDVWSFGVLLWEIVTLGEYPYSEVNNADLLSFLKNGYRMKKPPHCGIELYQIMMNCWKEKPKDRPTFTELRKQLETLLEDAFNYVKL